MLLQNLSEQDIYFDSNLKELIGLERGAVDLYDQRDSKGQISSISFKFTANSVAPSNEVWKIGDRVFALIIVQLHALTTIQQLQLYSIVLQNVLAPYQRAVVEEATYIPLICYENFLWTNRKQAKFGSVVGRSSQLPYAQ